MKKKVSFFERISSGKGFYITASVCICIIFAAIAVIYNSSLSMLEGVLPQETTAQVRKNETGVKDPRVTEKETTEKTAEKKEAHRTNNQ